MAESWEVQYEPEFEAWFLSLGRKDAEAQASLTANIELLRKYGPVLGRPYVDHVKGSGHSNMKELRDHCRGMLLRVFFVFDPARKAVLLIGGDKRGEKRFYERMVPVADSIYDRHLRRMRGDKPRK